MPKRKTLLRHFLVLQAGLASRTLRPRPNGFQRSRDGGHDSDVVSAFSSSSNTRAVAPLAASENSSSEWAVTW
ncbi:hypothetical protein EPAKOI_003581 [Cupriavidus sp. H18C2]